MNLSNLKDRALSATKKTFKFIDTMSNKVANIIVPLDTDSDTEIGGHKYRLTKEVLDAIKGQIYKEPGEELFEVKLEGIIVYITEKAAKYIVQNCKEI